MKIIGLNAFHGDSAACLFINGELQCAAEEERFRRQKHWAGFPSESIKFCLSQQGLSLADIDIIAINTDPSAARFKKLGYVLSGRAPYALVREKLRVRKRRKSIEQYLAECFPTQSFKGQIEYVEHHLAHLASAYNMSGFPRASVISVDGFGDFASSAWGYGEESRLELQRRVLFPHSLGIFYQALTQYLGFQNYGDEYKVMGLAPYGEVNFRSQMDRVLQHKADGSFALNLDYFVHQKQAIGYEWEDGSPQVSRLYSDALVELLGPVRTRDEPLGQYHKDIARSVQDAYERALFHMLNHLHGQHRCENLAIAGGCGMNSVANGKIHLRTPYKNIYVQAAAGDAGGAIGAAQVAGSRRGVKREFSMQHAYWGSSFSESEYRLLLEKNQAALAAKRCTVIGDLSLEELTDRVSDQLIAGKVVGWFQGAMEWGPRALGNRSILGDPRRKDMKDILNLKIKRRESFRPFAPSILREHVSQWFESDADVPFMMKVFQISAEQREKIPAVTHVDGSGRLQTVSAEHNPRYYQLISSFYKKTGVPILLNTSFNENEPIVCKPEEALDCFLRTNMDVLVLGSQMIVREERIHTEVA